MKVSPATLAFAAVIALGVAPGASAERQSAHPRPRRTRKPAKNGGHFVEVCFNGLQGGKVVVPEGKVVDEELETTVKACRIDGGDEAKVPRSPIIPRGKRRDRLRHVAGTRNSRRADFLQASERSAIFSRLGAVHDAQLEIPSAALSCNGAQQSCAKARRSAAPRRSSPITRRSYRIQVSSPGCVTLIRFPSGSRKLASRSPHGSSAGS